MSEPNPTDRISLRGMRFIGRHGVELRERLEPQPFEVDLDLYLDLAPAIAADDLARTVDYAALFEQVQVIVETGSYRLIEALAGAIAESVLRDHPQVAQVQVAVRKPKAPLPGTFETVEVSLLRERTPGG